MTAAEYEVIIVGYGPVGTTAANLLGMYGVRTLVLEKEDAVYRLPRAGTCDDEVMRIWQSIGLADSLMPRFLPQNRLQFLDRPHGKPFLDLRRGGFGYGFPALTLLYQPFLEETLRNAVSQYPCVEVRLQHEAEDLTDSGELVTVKVRNHRSGEAYDVTGKYVLGCDGGRSTVRQRLGIELRGKTFQRWLVVDIGVDNPAKFPQNMQFVCDPRRPKHNYPMALNHHRFQFMLEDHETPEQMETVETVRTLLAPWADLDQVRLVRKAVYIYHARIAEKWRVGRIFLAGDAVHLTPPFAGQGMSSGIRDVGNLCWKLAFVLQERADDRILDSYEVERPSHVAKMTRLALTFGGLLQTRNRVLVALRNLFCRILSHTPVVGPFVLSGEFKPGPRIPSGLMADGRRKGRRAPEGTLFIQPKVQRLGGDAALLDDFLGNGFTVLGMRVDPRQVMDERSRPLWERLSTRFVRIVPLGEQASPLDGVETVVDSEGKLAAWFDRHKVDVAALRPDRYVFAGFSTARDTPGELAQQLRHQLATH